MTPKRAILPALFLIFALTLVLYPLISNTKSAIPPSRHRTNGKSYCGKLERAPLHSFHWVGTSNQLYVFEAPIDQLSYITLHPERWREHGHVSLCGTSKHTMLWMLEQYSHPDMMEVFDHHTEIHVTPESADFGDLHDVTPEWLLDGFTLTDEFRSTTKVAENVRVD